jgi:hypothetical protein
MGESQNHGFLFEDEIIKSVTGVDKDTYADLIKKSKIANKAGGSYRSPWDIYKGIESSDYYSIKTSAEGNGVGCGDITRFMTHLKKEPFKMVIGCWSQTTPEKKTYNKIVEIIFTPIDYEKLFGKLTPAAIKPFDEYVKSIPPGKEAQKENQNLWKEKRKELYSQFACGNEEQYAKIVKGKLVLGVMTIDAKIDSGEQRRVQCGFKLSSLLARDIKYTIYDKDYKGIKLPYVQNSKPRKRNKKTK